MTMNKCSCGERNVNECDEEWGPDCDLGNNEKYVKVSQVNLPAPVAQPLTWYEGAPPFPQDQEWFIAETIYGDRVVLRSLDEGREHKHTYDFKTADGTYMATRIIKRWMQFPDCAYLPPATPAPVATPAENDNPSKWERNGYF
jgi:hypothetical protein